MTIEKPSMPSFFPAARPSGWMPQAASRLACGKQAAVFRSAQRVCRSYRRRSCSICLNGGDKDWGLHSPYRDMGYAAFMAAAKGEFPLGTVGAGTGATTATFKGGLGSASAVSSAGHRIAAIVAVNALGSATIGDGPHFWAAPFERDGEFGGLGMPAAIDHRLRLKGMTVPATTIGAVVTDAALTKAEAHRLSIGAHDGFARALLPAHLPLDGDTVFAASTGARLLADMAS